MDHCELWQGDCLELMQNISPGSIDMILCDLPYGKTQCGWDKPLPIDQLWDEYKRVIKPTGAIVLFGQEPFASQLRTSNLAWYKYDWIWRKPRGTGHLNAKKQPLRDMETISVFYQRQCTYNPQLSPGEPYTNKSGKTPKLVTTGKTTYGTYMDGNAYRNPNSGFRYPKQVIEFGVVERGTIHQTQKPVPLLEYLIKTYTSERERVLDNCMGSGSTAIACLNTNRDFIGIEIDPEIYQLAKGRVEQWQNQKSLSTSNSTTASSP